MKTISLIMPESWEGSGTDNWQGFKGTARAGTVIVEIDPWPESRNGVMLSEYAQGNLYPDCGTIIASSVAQYPVGARVMCAVASGSHAYCTRFIDFVWKEYRAKNVCVYGPVLASGRMPLKQDLSMVMPALLTKEGLLPTNGNLVLRRSNPKTKHGILELTTSKRVPIGTIIAIGDDVDPDLQPGQTVLYDSPSMVTELKGYMKCYADEFGGEECDYVIIAADAVLAILE